MAIHKNDPFPGTDYSKYLEWSPVKLPSGETYYEVPGHPGYVYDPVASNASGRKVFRPNPKGQITKIQEEEERVAGLQKQQAFNQSPAGQLLPVAAGTAGLIAASKFGGAAAINPLAALGAGAVTPAGAAATGAIGAPALAAPAALGAPALAAPAGATVVPAAASVAPVAETAGLASGYGIGAGPLALVAAGTYLGGKSAYDMFNGKTDKSIPGLIGRGTLGIATGGLSELARPFIMHESTRDSAKKHTKELLKEGKDDAVYQSYVKGMREQYNSAPVDPSKPFAGKYASWDEYKKGGLEAADLTGVYGNIKTYGPEYASLTFDQQKAITQANIDSGIYDSKKGDVIITDEKKALENKNNVLKGFSVGAKAATTPAAPVVATPAPVVAAPVEPVLTPSQAAGRAAVDARLKKILR